MNTPVLYFILANIGLAAFYLFFRLFLQRDTFFVEKRIAMLAGIILALTYPVLDVSNLIQRNDSLVEYADVLRSTLPEIPKNEAKPMVEATPTSETAAIASMSVQHEPENGVQESKKDALITSSFTLFDYLFLLYILTTAVLLFRIARQLLRILKFRQKAERRSLHNQWIYVLKGCKSPFSFFGAVFMDPDAYSDSNQLEIIQHEKAHIKQGHSYDVFFSELVCALFWINPFAWLLKRCLRENLEFLADRDVIKKGVDPKTYQYKLLQLSCHRSDANLANHFNVSQLKKRIVMMNKKRTSWAGLSKYALYLPLFAALLLTAYAWGQQHKNEAKDLVAKATADSKLISALTIDNATALAQNTPDKKAAEQPAETTQAASAAIWNHKLGSRTIQVYNKPDQAVQFPGGLNTLYDYFKNNLKFPNEAKLKGEQGWLNAQFIVDEHGILTDIKHLTKERNGTLSNELWRVFSNLRRIRWKPAIHEGVAVASSFIIPFVFRFEGEHPVDESTLANCITIVTKRDPVAEKQYKNKDYVFSAEIMPQFPGGQAALFNYLYKELRNPQSGAENLISVHFTVDRSGSVSQVDVYDPEQYDPVYLAEAIRVVKEMPKWSPGEDKGQNVAVQLTLPILFNPSLNVTLKTKLVVDKNEPKLLVYNGRIINKDLQLNTDTMQQEDWIKLLGLGDGSDNPDFLSWSTMKISSSAPILVNAEQPYVYGMIALSSKKR